MPSQSPRPRELVALSITDLNTEGQGVARLDGSGLVVFVPGALPGEEVMARVTRVGGGGSYLVAEPLRIEKASPNRVEAQCAVSASCGGCQLLHYDYRSQLEWKTTVVRETLRRIGGLQNVAVEACLGARSPLAYRNKAQFPVAAAYRQSGGWWRQDEAGPRPRERRNGRSRMLVAGLYRRGTHEVISVDSCPLQRPTNNRAIATAVRLAGEHGVSAYDEETGRGQLRHILARASRDGREAMCVLVTAEVMFPQGRRLAAALREAVPEVKTVVQNVNTRRTSVILGPRDIVLSGPGFIHDTLGGLRFRVSPSSFFQVNPEQAEVLYDVAAGMAAGARRAADIYCGVGTITLYLARRLDTLQDIVGVESNSAAVRDAEANARANRVEKASFVRGDAAMVLRDMAASGYRPDTVVLDPPRKGCEKPALDALAALRPERIVYISCNPATLARDLGHLAEWSYRVERVQPVDMFPQTTHVECCALVVRDDGSASQPRRTQGSTGRSSS